MIVADRPYQDGMTISDPLPLVYQTGFPPETFAFIPQRVGQYAQAPMLERFARALAAGFSPQQVEDSGGLDIAAGARTASPILAVTNRAKHTTYQIFVADGEDQQILPHNPFRTFLQIINVATGVGALISFDVGSDNGIPLAAAPAAGQWGGDVSLPTGTVSAVHAQGVGGQAELRIIEGSSYPASLCELPGCAPVEVH